MYRRVDEEMLTANLFEGIALDFERKGLRSERDAKLAEVGRSAAEASTLSEVTHVRMSRGVPFASCA